MNIGKTGALKSRDENIGSVGRPFAVRMMFVPLYYEKKKPALAQGQFIFLQTMMCEGCKLFVSRTVFV